MEKPTSRALERALSSLNKMYGPNTVIRLGDLPTPADNIIPAGIESLDAALGIGGIPKGRIVEIFGPDGAGKTALALQLAAQVPTVLYIDADHGLSPCMTWSLSNWHNGFYLLSVDTLEDALQACLCAAPAFDLIVIDTLAALPTEEDGRCDLSESYRTNPTARILARALPLLSASLAKSGCTLVLVNQVRERPGVVYGNPEHAPGGHALKHYAAMRLDVRRINTIREGQEITGQQIRVNVVKNKCAPPFRTAILDLRYRDGRMKGSCGPVERTA